MNPMDLQYAITHYRRLIKEIGWLEERMAWTVILPVSGRLSLQETATRLTGGSHPELSELDPGLPDVVYLGQSGAAVMLFEATGFSHAGGTQVLERLSENARVWHVAWNITGMRVLIHAAQGKVLARIPEFAPDWLNGIDPDSLREEAAILRGIGRYRPPTRYKTKVMAMVEQRTGARLDKQWFDRPRPAVPLWSPAEDIQRI
ncbi:hypothetical protein SAMN05216276_108140 [Streptosporangium subroseum]|uniref:Uncharacterized protein n=2 Tax=Streptosporangium subroseum TaxID=106412 RepID=A0A239P1R0_9ACTN|nr:hypothetical protein SAMN05216276_108140 [Streptosporangium subroseum]